nr:transposase, MuDR, MULE transposase domain protein [Tanacetum cinerariifolium]
MSTSNNTTFEFEVHHNGTLPPNNALSGLKQIKNDYDTNVMYDIARVAGKIQLFISYHQIDLSTVLIPNDGSLEEALEDAAHLMGQHKGTNLIVVGMDGNNQIVPIAFGICKGETVQDEFPLSYHAICCRHLMMNLSLKRDKTKALFWRICKAYTTEEFATSMSHLQDIQTDAYDKLCQVGPQRWLRAHCPLVRYNYLISNSVESVNACIVVYRKLPVLKLAVTYRAMVQEWYYQRRKLTENMTYEITDWAVNKVRKNGQECTMGCLWC